MHSTTFDEDLKIGERAEIYALKLIQKFLPEAYKIEGYHKEYDIYDPSSDTSFEVKLGNQAHETREFLIEIMHGGVLSGLFATKATYWMIMSKSCLITIKPERIKDCIIQRGLVYTTITGPGDSHSKRVVIISLDLLEKYSENVYYIDWENEQPE